MRRNIFTIFTGIVIMAFIAGCTNSPAGPEDNNVYINVIMQYSETAGGAVSQYAAYACDSTGATLTSAAVSMSGPDGVLPGSMTSGVFIYQDLTGASFHLSSQYAVSVTYNAVNYYGTVLTNGAIAIAADGSTVTWGYDADAEFITVMTPVPGFLYYGTALNSPFNLNSAGAYAAGSGDYMISAQMTDKKTMVVTGEGVVASAVIQHTVSAQVSK